jgi:hypothetical protein
MDGPIEFNRTMLRPRRALALGAPIILALSLASAAAAFDVPIAQLRGLAQTYEPGVFLPRVLPSTVTKADIGAASGIGNGPAPNHFLAYHTGGGRIAFQLGIWRGDRRTAIVKGLRFHDGTQGSAHSFTAGRFTGTMETQHAFTAGKPNVVSYVWKGGGYSYMLVVLAKPGTTTAQFPGLKPLATIASFRV